MLTTDQLQKYPFFAGLSNDDLVSLLPHFHKRAFGKGVYLFYPQSPSATTYFVETGLVRLFFTNAHGEEFLLNILKPTAVFGLPVLDEEKIRLMGAATYQESVILSIPSEILITSMQTMPELARNLYHEASSSARQLLIHTRSLVTLSLNARVAFLLLRLSQLWQTADVIEMPINQAELAGWVGASRGRLNQALGELQKQGLIRLEEDARILLIDRAGLVRLAKAVM